VAPTTIPEGLGNVVHEAMSKGRAMIGTTPGGHEDMIEDGVNGLIVPAGDAEALTSAMGRLVEDRELRERMGERARERAHDFTAEVIVPQLERLYLETVERYREQRP
jgi:glycogen synthase